MNETFGYAKHHFGTKLCYKIDILLGFASTRICQLGFEKDIILHSGIIPRVPVLPTSKSLHSFHKPLAVVIKNNSLFCSSSQVILAFIDVINITNHTVENTFLRNYVILPNTKNKTLPAFLLSSAAKIKKLQHFYTKDNINFINDVFEPEYFTGKTIIRHSSFIYRSDISRALGWSTDQLDKLAIDLSK